MGNILIHYVSTKGYLSKREFNDVVFLLLENGENTQVNIKKIAVQLSYLLQELGYVDNQHQWHVVLPVKPDANRRDHCP